MLRSLADSALPPRSYSRPMASQTLSGVERRRLSTCASVCRLHRVSRCPISEEEMGVKEKAIFRKQSRIFARDCAILTFGIRRHRVQSTRESGFSPLRSPLPPEESSRPSLPSDSEPPADGRCTVAQKTGGRAADGRGRGGFFGARLSPCQKRTESERRRGVHFL